MKRLYIFLFFLFTCCCGVFFSSNTYAISDYNLTWSFDSHPQTLLCGGESGRSCSDYSYVIFHPTGTCTDGLPAFYVNGLGSFSGNSMVSPCSDIIAPINSSALRLTGGVYLDTRYSGNIEITLTDSLSEPCPEPPPCEDPEENSTYIKVVLDAFWKYHTVFAGCVASIIAIFVVYRIIKGMLR